MTEVNSLQLNKYYNNLSENLVSSLATEVQAGPSFLTVTNRFDFSQLGGVVYADEDVLSGDVQSEIEKLQTEEDQINALLQANTSASSDLVVASVSNTFQAKDIGFVSYEETLSTLNSTASVSSGKNISEKTDTTNILKSIQYSDNYNTEVQQKIIEGGIQLLVNWLDDYINNYDERVAEGKANGESEVKLSFLLRLRKSIENCDFPIGFGNDEYFQESSEDGYVVLGAYSSAYNTSYYLNPEDHANENVGALQQTNRSIIFNASVFMIDRPYTNETQLRNAINNGEFDYLFEDDITQADINEAYAAMVLASDEVYYNFSSAYFASILAHELIHSTHITNEVVTYNTCEMIEDDFRDQIISANWSSSTQVAVDQIFMDLNLNQLTYGDIYLPTGDGGGLSFHDLEAYDEDADPYKDSVLEHGHEENMAYNEDTLREDGTIAYKGYANFTTGNTLEDDIKELLNFIV